jgi:hypothetical protein
MRKIFVAIAMLAVLGSANAQTTPSKKASDSKCCEAKKAGSCATKDAGHCTSAHKEKAAATATSKKAVNKKG